MVNYDMENKMMTEEQIAEELSGEVLNDAIFEMLQGDDQIFFEYFIEGMSEEDLMLKFNISQEEYDKKIDNFRGVWQKILDEKLQDLKLCSE